MKRTDILKALHRIDSVGIREYQHCLNPELVSDISILKDAAKRYANLISNITLED